MARYVPYANGAPLGCGPAGPRVVLWQGGVLRSVARCAGSWRACAVVVFVLACRHQDRVHRQATRIPWVALTAGAPMQLLEALGQCGAGRSGRSVALRASLCMTDRGMLQGYWVRCVCAAYARILQPFACSRSEGPSR